MRELAIARAVHAEARNPLDGSQSPRAGRPGTATWFFLSLVTAVASAPALVLGRESGFAAFLCIQALMMTLVTISAAGQVRSPAVLSFLISLPLLPRNVARVTGIATLLSIALPVATFPLVAILASSIIEPGSINGWIVSASSIIVSAWPVMLSFLLPILPAKKTPVKRRETPPDAEAIISVQTTSPRVAIGLALLAEMCHDSRHVASILAPAVAALAIILADFTFQASDPVNAFFWLYILTGFLPFFISFAVTDAGERLMPGFQRLPRFSRHLLAAKQTITGMLFLAILLASTALVAINVSDTGEFLLLAISLPLTGWLSCTLALLALEALGHVVRVGKHFLVLILGLNIFGSMFWNLSMIEPLGPAATTASMIVMSAAGILLLEALKRLIYRWIG